MNKRTKYVGVTAEHAEQIIKDVTPHMLAFMSDAGDVGIQYTFDPDASIRANVMCALKTMEAVAKTIVEGVHMGTGVDKAIIILDVVKACHIGALSAFDDDKTSG